MLESDEKTEKTVSPPRESLPRFVVLKTERTRVGGRAEEISLSKTDCCNAFCNSVDKKKETNVICTQNNGQNYPNKRGEIRMNFGVEKHHTNLD